MFKGTMTLRRPSAHPLAPFLDGVGSGTGGVATPSRWDCTAEQQLRFYCSRTQHREVCNNVLKLKPSLNISAAAYSSLLPL